MAKGPGIGPKRPAERFERVYSPPERPRMARRPRGVVLFVGALAFVLAGGAVFLLLPGGSPGRPPITTPTATPTATPTRKAPFTALPDPCKAVARGTLDRLVPGARQDASSSGSTDLTCTFTVTKKHYRWLRVDAMLFPAGEADARRILAASIQEKAVHAPGSARAPQRFGGLGDEAFRTFEPDEHGGTVTATVGFRLRNAVVQIRYSEEAPGGAADSARAACLADAERAARDVLAGFR